jgi:hypothetical protein
MKLRGLITQGSGAVNEDNAGVIETNGAVTAAWVLDGVTGINSYNCFKDTTDAAWFVSRVQHHLQSLAAKDETLFNILSELVEALTADWNGEADKHDLPHDFDIPASCLILAKKYLTGWQALRLGDSLLLAEHEGVKCYSPPPSDLDGLEATLRKQAAKLRKAGTEDFKDLLPKFHDIHLASRQQRNTKQNHSILVPNRSSLNIPEIIDLGQPKSLLLCTDGFYRAVDVYHAMTDADLLVNALKSNGVDSIVSRIRDIERTDPHCEIFSRFKPADDASAVALS